MACQACPPPPKEERRYSVVSPQSLCIHKNLDVVRCMALRTYIDRQIDRLGASNRAAGPGPGPGH